MLNKSIYKLSSFVTLFLLIIIFLQSIVNFLLGHLQNFIKAPQLIESLGFFLKEVLSILIILSTAIFFLSLVRSYISKEKSLKILSKVTLFKGNVIASLFGIITPFCSGGVVPLFLGLVQSGVSLGVSLSLLIAAPMINEIALILLFGLFGWKTALLYVFTGLAISISSGYIIGKLGFEKYVQEWVKALERLDTNSIESDISFSQRIDLAFLETRKTVSKIWIFIIVGMGVGSVLYGYVPKSLMIEIMGKSQWWSVPIAVLIGIPLYMNSAGIIPIVQVLLSKGAALGTSLAFMMSVIGLSLPEIIILKKVLKLPLILIFITIVAFGITIVGYLFNIIY